MSAINITKVRIQETLFLNSISGMTESIIKGMEMPIEDCIPEEQVNWE